MDKMLFLYNPKSGKGQIKEQLSDIINYYSSENILTSVYATQKSLDGENKTEKIGGDFDYIVVAGGDGTLDEIVNGVMKSGIKPAIGYIPTGTTNDFSTTIGIPTNNLMKAAEISIKGKKTNLDIGILDDKYFVYVAAFGAFADVSYETDQGMKNMFGHAAYVLNGIKSVPNLKSYKLKLTVDGEVVEGDFALGMITNSVSVGGFKGLINDVELNDGKFEITLIRKPKSLIDLNEIVLRLTIGSGNTDLVYTGKGKNISIESEEEIKRSLDGEYGGSYKKSSIEIINKAITINTGIKN